jgi:hypothetical protein
MNIAPISSSGNTIGSISTGSDSPQQPMPSKLRSIRMATNATPERMEEEQVAEVQHTQEATAATEEHQPLSPQAAALAKQRRSLQVKEREIIAREKALSEQSAPTADRIEMAKIKADPLGVLLQAGVTYDELTEAVLASSSGGQSHAEIQALKAEIKALKEGVDKNFADRETLAEQQALAEMRKEAVSMSAQGEEYELVRETGSIPDVMRLIETTYRKTGEVLDVQEALQLVEAELIQESLKVANFNKVRGQLQQAQPVQQPSQLQRQARTLTNRDNASVQMSRKARAMAAFQGKLIK